MKPPHLAVYGSPSRREQTGYFGADAISCGMGVPL